MNLFRQFWQWLTNVLETDRILCDDCRYDHPHACRNPDRPNATRCKNYKKR